jgi:branched-chain amino acid transport system substrate-binding protein
VTVAPHKVSLVMAVAALAVSAACGGSGGSGSSGSSSKPLVIGISLSFSGDFSDPGHAAELGYKLWADTVNKQGGILGRKVVLKIVDDASSPDQVVTNYQTLITRDKVDLVFGPFSTLLTAPAARVAARYNYAFPEPSGGGPIVFQEKLGNVFFVQPAPVVNCGDPFVKYILSLPSGQRPKTAAYPELDDPFAAPIAERARQQFEAAGIKTVFKEVYPPEMADLTPVVEKMAAAKPDMVFAGTQSDDAYSMVNAMVQLGFSPKFLFQANGANSPVEFPSKVGAKNTAGIFSCGDWFPDSKAPGNQQFIQQYIAKYGGTSANIDSGSAEAYAVGEVVAEVAQKTGKVDNATIIKSLHSGSWPTVEGNLSWDKYGAPSGSTMLTEWIDGKLLPVDPPAQALHAPVIPKPPWGG